MISILNTKWIHGKLLKFCHKNSVWPKLWFLEGIWIFGRNLDFWLKFVFSAEIWIFFRNLDFFFRNLDFFQKFGFFSEICIFFRNLDFFQKFGFFGHLKVWTFGDNLDFWKNQGPEKIEVPGNPALELLY